MSKEKAFSKLEQPCDDCDEPENTVFRDGKIELRFIRSKKKPAGSMLNYKDGQTYWMYPRHAAFPWWEPVEKINFPIVPPATQKDSVYVGDLDDLDKPAYIGRSGMSVKPGAGVVGQFVEPSAEAEIIAPDVPQRQPSEDWTKKELLDYITEKGGFAEMGMKKSWLLGIAKNLAG